MESAGRHFENRTFTEIRIGDSAGPTRTLTQPDIELFAACPATLRSRTSATLSVLVIPADEEAVIAAHTARALGARLSTQAA